MTSGLMADPSMQEDIKILPLREDLHLLKGPATHDGAPTWTLQDPLRNQFFRLGWVEYEILARWHFGDADMIVNDINKNTALEINKEHIEGVLKFVSFNQLIRVSDGAGVEQLHSVKSSGKQSALMWLLKNYLFFRVPLCRPAEFLRSTLPMIRFMYTKKFLYFMLTLGMIGVYLAVRRWDTFMSTFPYFFSIQGFLIYFVAIIFSKMIHELGHAYTATYHGARVSSMGVAFLVMFPVFYTDTTDSWRFPKSRQRFHVAIGGIVAEMYLTLFALFMWHFLPPGPLQSAVFTTATVTWILTLAVNLSPFMRFDGYYILSDLVAVENLQTRGFAITRWWMREKLFGFNHEPPEEFSDRMTRFMLFYSFGTWIYRFFLFLGIAVLVYYMAFKVLGIILFIAEIIWFIGRPVWNEISVWIKMREEMTWNKHTITTTIIFVTLLILFFVPWRSDIQLPAVFRADVDQKIYAPAPGRVDEILVKKGQSVKKGETLIRFAAPDTYFRKRQADARVKSLQHDLDRQSSNERTIENVRVLATQLAEAQAESRGYNEELQQLDIKAPFDGIVEDLYDKLRPNIWLNPEQLLAIIVQPSVGAIEAYITEDDLKVVNSLTENKAENTKGVFYADNLEGSFDVRTQSIASANTSVLLSPYLASQHGGGVAVRPDKKDGMVPEKTIYRMVMMPAKPMASPERVTRGYIQLSGKRYSVAGRLVRLVAKVLIQESGF